jgi:ABC-type lipoprotein export system ATPase subunit
MSGTDPLIRIRDLRYRYPGADHDVLRIQVLDVHGTGLIAVTGPSGAGKSTLIEILAGTLRGTYSGSVQVLGREWSDLRRDADRQRHLRRIGFIPQDYGLLTDRSVTDLLSQDLRDAGVEASEHQDRIRRALHEVAMDGFEDRQVAALSGGQRQRVAIARMLARDVELVIADEPTANLDPALTQETVALFRRLAERTPVLIITHDPVVAAACDRTIVLQSTVADAEPAVAQSPSQPGGRRLRTGWIAAVAALALGTVISVTIVTAGSGTTRSGQAASATKSTAPGSHAGIGQPVTTTTVGAKPRPSTTTVAPSTSARQVLAPASVPPSVDECSQQLTFAVDGNAGPISCSNGTLNVVAWRYFAQDKHSVMSLGPYATPVQVSDALCADGSTIPIETSAYQLSALYYGWSFAEDPSAILTNGGCQTTTTPATSAPRIAAPPTTSRPLPAAPPCGITGPVVKPNSILLGCATGADELFNLRWTVWSSTSAGGVGTASIRNCVPDCQSGSTTTFPVNVQLSNPGYVNGVYVFQTISTYLLSRVGQAQSSSDPGSGWGAAGNS